MNNLHFLITIIIFTTIAFASLLYRASAISFGPKPPDGTEPFAPAWTMMLSFGALLAITIIMGIAPPQQFIQLLEQAMHAITGV